MFGLFKKIFGSSNSNDQVILESQNSAPRPTVKSSVGNENPLIQLNIADSQPFMHIFETHWQKVGEVSGIESYTVYGLGKNVVRYSMESGLIEGYRNDLIEVHNAIAEEFGTKLDNFEGILDNAQRNQLSWTPLTYAAGTGDMATVKYLCQNGAELNYLDEVGKTPLMHAARKSNFEIIKVMVESGVDVNQFSNSNTTALMAACNLGDLETVKYLLDNGADKNLKDVNGWTASKYAEDKGQDDIILLLKN